jgi:hypothetical protein
MEEKIDKLILDKKPIHEKIAGEKEIKKIVELANYASQSKEKGHSIESFLLVYQLMQDIFLPNLRRLVLHRLGLDELEKRFVEENSPYIINLEYVALTHDIELFGLLEKARKIRNEIVHTITKDETLEISQNKAKEALKLTGNLIYAIIDRLQGRKAIPVLTLYPKGWNDCREEVIKVIEKLFKT